MKVIQHGRKPDPLPSYWISCPRCLAILEFDMSDTWTEDGPGFFPVFVSRNIQCPECHRTITVGTHPVKNRWLGRLGGLGPIALIATSS